MRIVWALAMTTALAGTSFAQNVISAKAGLVHHSSGDVLVAGKPVERKTAIFTTVKAGETLVTGEGRAEMLLGPGVFLRMGENSQIRLVNAELTDVRVQLLQGSLILEAAESEKDNRTTITYKEMTFTPVKDGVYGIESEPSLRVRVWQGEASVLNADKQTITVKGGREYFAENGSSQVAKFDKNDSDALYRWAKRRSGYIAVANISGAKNADEFRNPNTNVGAGRLLMGFSGGSPNAWLWNPYMNMFTYVPTRGHWTSPFGFTYYSPSSVLRLYQPSFYSGGYGRGDIAGAGSWSPQYNPNTGYSTVPMRSAAPSMNSGGGMSSGAPIAAPSAPAGGGAPAAAPGGGGRAGGGSGGRGK